MTSRAHLLAGLRTGGPRSASPFEGEDQQFSNKLKASAVPFTPGNRTASNGAHGHSLDHVHEIESQFAALRMQQALSGDEQPQSLAALYGASNGQPASAGLQQQNAYDIQAQEMENLIRQKQAQLLQIQLQQQRQQQLESIRQHVADQQMQQQQQQLANQQRLILAQLQAELEAQAQLQEQEHYTQQVYSAHEQRQAAQASIQASLRQRQAQQMYAQLLQQQHQHQQSNANMMFDQQFSANSQSKSPRYGDLTQESVQSMGMQQARLPIRSASPGQTQNARRERQVSNNAADKAVSWRSSSTSLGSKGSSKRLPPSIVVDDGASEKSDNGTSSSASEPIDTPEISEEDVVLVQGNETTGGISMSSSASTIKRLPSTITPLAAPRIMSLSSAPRMRTTSSNGEYKSTGSPTGNSNGNSIQASRQPRGPPTEFHSVNFASRLSARTRKDAMSKLCASPRAASFNLNGAVRVSSIAA